MKKTKTNLLIEYLTPILILSYFFVHNIFLVVIGIVFSLYLLNINMINNIIESITKNLVTKKAFKEVNKIDKEFNLNNINIRSTKEDSKLTLVEEIEELGFIPSMDKEDNTNAA